MAVLVSRNAKGGRESGRLGAKAVIRNTESEIFNPNERSIDADSLHQQIKQNSKKAEQCCCLLLVVVHLMTRTDGTEEGCSEVKCGWRWRQMGPELKRVDRVGVGVDTWMYLVCGGVWIAVKEGRKGRDPCHKGS